MDNSQAIVRQVIAIGGSIFVIAMAYGSGMRARTKQIQDEYEAVKVYKQELRVVQLEGQARDAQLHQLEARRLLDVARDALAKGDAATAKADVGEAVTRLKTAAKADAATTADFTGLTNDLANVDFANASGAKMALDGFAGAMDDAFAKTNEFPAADAMTSVTIPPPTDNDKPAVGNDISASEGIK